MDEALPESENTGERESNRRREGGRDSQEARKPCKVRTRKRGEGEQEEREREERVIGEKGEKREESRGHRERREKERIVRGESRE